ncbi:MAG: twin-arginine translocation signal domain-containing protein, partial [Planctomycetes bacterium]|nr:twin-arginine translocation signal domain-containing protein [Planctomycetota bacterium]
MKKSDTTKGYNRRQFLKTTGAAGAVLGSTGLGM